MTKTFQCAPNHRRAGQTSVRPVLALGDLTHEVDLVTWILQEKVVRVLGRGVDGVVASQDEQILWLDAGVQT